MNYCKYYDCGWCYAPDDVKTNTIQSACVEPDYCPYLKSQNQMTNEQTLEYEIKEYALEIEQKAKEIGKLKDILDRKEQQLKQMTETDISKVLIEGDTATIMGVKYKRVEEPKPQTLKELFQIYVEYGNWAQSKEVIAQELVNIVKEFIPEPVTYDGEEYQLGWNDAIKTLKDKLR
jgi:hypothetical protein